jgi:hypothetical protein
MKYKTFAVCATIVFAMLVTLILGYKVLDALFAVDAQGVPMWAWYLSSQSQYLKDNIGGTVAATVFGGVAMFIVFCVPERDFASESSRHVLRGAALALFMGGIFGTIFIALLPSKDLCIQMLERRGLKPVVVEKIVEVEKPTIIINKATDDKALHESK